MNLFKLTCFVFMITLMITSNVFAQADFPAPETMSSENPAAIPADHKAILESANVVSKINEDSTLKYQKQLKKVQLLKSIAVEQQQIAEANAATCKLNRNLCKDLGISAYEENVLTPEEVNKRKVTQEHDAKIEREKAKQNAIIGADKSLIAGIQLLGIIDGKALLVVEGSQVTLGVNESFNNMVVKQIVGESVIVSAKRTGLIKKLVANGIGSYPVGTISPFPKEDSEVKEPGTGF